MCLLAFVDRHQASPSDRDMIIKDVDFLSQPDRWPTKDEPWRAHSDFGREEIPMSWQS